MQIGASFSHDHLKHLKLDPTLAIKEFNKLDLKWIRLGCYWKDIEKIEAKYDFSEIEALVRYCQREKINILMTVGMKAPRMPEYYLPDWLEKRLNLEINSAIRKENKLLLDKTKKYIKECVKQLGKYSAIKVWQVENEPLDPSGPAKIKIDKGFLQKEVALVQTLDSNRKILVNLWGNTLSTNNHYKTAINLADIVGLDLYPKQYAEHLGRYIGPLGPQFVFKHKVNKIKMKSTLWITELQAEPWEPVDAYEKDDPKSFMPYDFEKNIRFAMSLNPQVVLLWGFEYWYLRKKKYQDERYWNEIKKLSNSFNSRGGEDY